MTPLLEILRARSFAALLGSVLVFLIIIALRLVGSFESLELDAYDWLIRLQPELCKPDHRITVIGISERDIRSLGRWPLTDTTLAQALTYLLKYKPRAIGVDIFRDISVPPGRKELDSILMQNSNIIVAMKFGDGGVPPPDVLKSTDQVGFNDVLVDPGGIVRRGLLFLDDGKMIFYSFALRLALIYLKEKGITPKSDAINPQHICLGQVTIPPFESDDGGYVHADARGYQFLLDYKMASTALRSYSLEDLTSGKIDPEAIADKIVIIGVKAHSVKDLFYTPRSRGLQAEQQIPGILLHAQMTNQLLRFALDGTRPIMAIRGTLEAFWILLWALMGGGMGLWLRSAGRLSIICSAGLLIIFSTAYFAYLSRFWIPFVPPAISWLMAAAATTAYMSQQEKKERALLMQLFSKHVSKDIAERIWQQRDQFLKDGRPRPQKLVVTSFFSDLRGFTTVSERMEPQDLIDWVNTYLESMAQLIMEYGGVIDDYQGDGIKANFGVPVPRANEDEIRKDAVHAVNCALAMEKEIDHLNSLWSQKNLPSVAVRIGIYTGPAVAGLVGSSERLKYTTQGDTINIAARLESYEKDFAAHAPCRILIGESTLRYLDSEFKTEWVGEVSLRGKYKKVSVYRVMGKETGAQTIDVRG